MARVAGSQGAWAESAFVQAIPARRVQLSLRLLYEDNLRPVEPLKLPVFVPPVSGLCELEPNGINDGTVGGMRGGNFERSKGPRLKSIISADEAI